MIAERTAVAIKVYKTAEDPADLTDRSICLF